MIIKEISIRNFRSYYGENSFKISPDLTLIIGGNGDGKTTFFEALEWLFKDTDDKSSEYMSAMRMSQMSIGEQDSITVSLLFDHNGIKELEKTILFEKKDNDTLRLINYEFNGYTDVDVERKKISGQVLLERCFDSIIRKYCLFKGEAELNVFDESSALKTLVDTFSGIREFDSYVNSTERYYNDANRAAAKEVEKDSKAAKKVRALSQQIENNLFEYNQLKRQYDENQDKIEDFEEKISKISDNEETYRKLNEITELIDNLRNEQRPLYKWINTDYNAKLLDDYWILCAFPDILDEFMEKANHFSLEKRRMEQEDAIQKGIEKGKEETLASMKLLANGVTPLPFDLPDKGTMQEMIDEEVCKVCGRKAEKGSEAYNFMVEKLNTYLAIIGEKEKAEKEKAKPLFVNNFIEEIHERSIRLGGKAERTIAQKENSITDEISFINDRKKQFDDYENKIKDVENDLDKFSALHPNISRDESTSSIQNLTGYFQYKEKAERDNGRIEEKIKTNREEKKRLDDEFRSLQVDSTIAKLYRKVSDALEHIKDAFASAKEENISNFIKTLEDESNRYLKLLNKNDFSGIIRIKKSRDNSSARIQLYSENDILITKPNSALKTTMYMSVLFAISNITTLKREQDYPLIFDAPTSSFEDAKEDEFYNVINTIKKQCIIVTKDLLSTDPGTGKKVLNKEKIDSLACSVYRIEKEEGYSETDLSTVRTIITPVQ